MLVDLCEVELQRMHSETRKTRDSRINIAKLNILPGNAKDLKEAAKEVVAAKMPNVARSYRSPSKELVVEHFNAI